MKEIYKHQPASHTNKTWEDPTPTMPGILVYRTTDKICRRKFSVNIFAIKFYWFNLQRCYQHGRALGRRLGIKLLFFCRPDLYIRWCRVSDVSQANPTRRRQGRMYLVQWVFLIVLLLYLSPSYRPGQDISSV